MTATEDSDVMAPMSEVDFKVHVVVTEDLHAREPIEVQGNAQ